MFYLLILTSLSCFLDSLFSLLMKIVMSWFFSESNEEYILRRELINIKTQLNNISIVDEFSKYAKLQRRYIKVEADAKKQIDARSMSRLKLKVFLNYGVRVLNGVFISALFFLYRKNPIVVFPKGYLWPFEQFLSWPTGMSGAISLPAWIVLMKLTASANYRLTKL